MIKAKRQEADLTFVNKPKDFHDKLKIEFETAKDYYSNPTKDKAQKPEFTCYRNPIIKNKLIEIFNHKCAYCDSNVTHISAGDVEHFRPKSKYWWFAADWNNLLFACEKCNRTGKNDEFPLSKNDFIYTYSEKEKFIEEETNYRLLINPCIEDPENYFEYDLKEAIIKPRQTVQNNSRKKIMAETSINVYKLQRIELVHEREKVLILLLAQIEFTKKAIENYQKLYNYPKGLTIKLEEKVKREIQILLEFNNSKRQYLGMVRQILRDFFVEHGFNIPESLKTSE
ncbi:retron system putative HNH endonuclease [Emticicia sp. BO119]|uniref:retron system putative HNH endonuclease n=1 Tax=Emticicia sp. BO119 TaxID=2757768 RepID=UPI0015F0ED22|nr:retron system putative HNH endonuclease [Emticicia sp. BO119]MBA4849451.1 TIGR02646 family protein [Emticicia sp. BO119]